MTGETSIGPVVDLSWIFNGPIEAVIKANIMAAREFVAFLETYAFIRSGDDPARVLGELRMVTFSFEQAGDSSGLPVKRLFRVPLASLIPLPLLEVKDATFEFGVRVLAAIETSPPPRVSLLRAVDPAEPDPTEVRWRAMLATGHTRDASSSTDDLTPPLAANMQAKVTVGQADIPAGIRNLLALMGENAQVTQAVLAVKPSALVWINPATARMNEDPTPSKPGQPIVLNALAARLTDQPPSVTAYYDATLVSLSTSDSDPWPSGSTRSTGGGGRLEALVSCLPHRIADPVQIQTKILFWTEAEGTSAVAELTCTIRSFPISRVVS